MAASKSTRTAKRKPAARKPANHHAAMIALYHLSNQMKTLATASQLMHDWTDGKLGDSAIEADELVDLCGGVIRREVDGLYETFEELRSAFDVEFSYWPAKELADAREFDEEMAEQVKRRDARAAAQKEEVRP